MPHRRRYSWWCGCPHELLLYADWSSHSVNPHPVRVPECVRAYVTDARFLAGPVKLSPESSVGIRQSAEFHRPSENPIAVRWKLCALLPHLQSVEKFIVWWILSGWRSRNRWPYTTLDETCVYSRLSSVDRRLVCVWLDSGPHVQVRSSRVCHTDDCGYYFKLGRGRRTAAAI